MSERLNVVFLAPLVAALAPVESCGNHVVLVDVARALAERGHRVRVVCADGSSVPGLELIEVPVDPAARGAFALLDRAGGTAAVRAAMRRAFARAFAVIRELAPDVVSQHAFDAEAIDLAHGVPTLHTLHLPPISMRVARALERAHARVATVSEACARSWRRTIRCPVGVLRNGIPVRAVARERRRGARGRARPFVLLAGRVSPEKGTSDGIRAASRAGLRAVVVGDLYDRAYAAREVLPLVDEERVDLGPAVPRAALWRLMHEAEACVMPIRWEEPFGLVAAEALVAGCPVVAYRRGALPELVEDGKDGRLVDPDDEAALAGALRRVAELDRAAIAERASARFGLDACVDAYEHALAAVAGGAACPTSPNAPPRRAAP